MKLRLSFSRSLFLLLALAFVQVASTSPPNDDGQEVHRYLTEAEEAECVLYLILGTEDCDSERWICRFTKEQAEELGIPAEMGVEGVPDDFFESAVSGGTLMKFRDGAFVKRASASQHKALGTLVVSRAGSVEVKAMSKDDPRHYRYYRKTTGNFRTLVVRIIDSLNKEPSSVQTLRKEIFTDSLNMKTQYKACSHGQMTTEEAGIVDVKVDVPLIEDTDVHDFGRIAKAEAEAKYGGGVGLEKKYDLVMFAYPPGKAFGAFAPMFSIDSYYSDWILYPSVQMHEIGHSLGLGHSMKDGEVYGDRASLMGDVGGEEGPHCFNPANNWQLRWYEKQQLSIKPWQLPGPQTFVLNGLDDYKPDGSSNGELVVLRLKYTGSKEHGWDYYVGYNRATGINSGVNAKPEFVDTLTVVCKIKGGMYMDGDTERWNVPVGESYTIIRPGFPDVYIDFQSIQNGGKDAIIVISNNSTPNPTPYPAPNPTPYPTPRYTPYPTPWWTSPTTLNCMDDDFFRFKGKKKKSCKWVGKGLNKLNIKNISKITKKCSKKVKGKKRVYDYCRATCAMIRVGPCAFVWP